MHIVHNKVHNKKNIIFYTLLLEVILLIVYNISINNFLELLICIMKKEKNYLIGLVFY